MTEAEVRARAAIQKTLAAIAQAGDARKADAYAECFAEDGVLILDARHEGRETIRNWMAAPAAVTAGAAAPNFGGFVSHHLTTCRIALTSATTAAVKTYWFVISAIGPDHSGYYDDVFVMQQDAWLIASRRPRTLWISPQSLIAGAERS